jgi:exonuclease-1
MGILGLISELLPLASSVHLSQFRNKAIGIDGYCWLHRSAYSCAAEIVQNKPTNRYLNFLRDMLNCLCYNNITPIIVLDGCELLAKQQENRIRAKDREMNKDKALQALVDNNNDVANEYFQRAITVTEEMIRNFISLLEEMKIRYIVAPYESDSQLTHLFLTKQIHLVITEDSDLLVL